MSKTVWTDDGKRAVQEKLVENKDMEINCAHIWRFSKASDNDLPPDMLVLDLEDGGEKIYSKGESNLIEECAMMRAECKEAKMESDKALAELLELKQRVEVDEADDDGDTGNNQQECSASQRIEPLLDEVQAEVSKSDSDEAPACRPKERIEEITITVSPRPPRKHDKQRPAVVAPKKYSRKNEMVPEFITLRQPVSTQQREIWKRFMSVGGLGDAGGLGMGGSFSQGSILKTLTTVQHEIGLGVPAYEAVDIIGASCGIVVALSTTFIGAVSATGVEIKSDGQECVWDDFVRIVVKHGCPAGALKVYYGVDIAKQGSLPTMKANNAATLSKDVFTFCDGFSSDDKSH
ncbi:hypothetical protein CEUSTIGMA_g5198.t1 [Chlamydomonas eustigma]|uniref:Uncharacterized protein n=1 Tax=Chlamydomonas eustigma TaxID=1157962 RepID=A0A250X3V8_9CHLO|nr:hypothetical protein CEUSTIGMA_g5198.t1 [Chlamydomonas eustigma]|eukprot:GAX77755.1 hypothetical protein CEUSTIGMA_g5198.t1 [Chlamydomonas eustigma]